MINNAGQIEDIYPLTPMQRGMLFHTLYAPQSGVYFQQVGAALRGAFDAAAFRRAWSYAQGRHTVLRGAVVWQGLDEPVLVVLRQVPLPIAELDWRGLPPQEQQQRVEQLLEDDRARGFDPAAAPLMRLTLVQLADDLRYLVWSRHHLLLDGWSVSLIMGEVLSCYAAFRHGRTPMLPPPRPYRAYLAWLQRQDQARAEAFWRAALAGFHAPTRLDIDRAAGDPSEPGTLDEQTRRLSQATTAALQALARRHRLTLNTLLQGAWALLLGRYSHQPEVVFGATTSGRPAELAGVESMAGMFINTLPVRVRVEPGQRLLAWLAQLQAQQAQARQYDHSPLVEVQGWSEVPRGTPLFESIAVFENVPPASQGQELTFEDVRTFERANYPLTLQVIPGQELLLRLIYDQARFVAPSVARMLGHLECILTSMAGDQDRCLADIPLLTEAERHELLALAPAVATPAACLHHVIAGHAKRAPDHVALVFERRRLTYRQLDQRANQLAHALRQLGVGPEVCVGLCLERSPELVVGMLGILKAGGACLLLDPADPAGTRARYLQAAGAAVLIADTAGGALPAPTPPLLRLDASLQALDGLPGDAPDVDTQPAGLAFVVAGAGRLVMIEHAALLNRIAELQRALELATDDGLLHRAAPAHPAAIWEICWPLYAGARLVVALAGGQDDREYLRQVIAEHKVSVAHLAARALPALLDAPAPRLPALRAVLVSGVALPQPLLDRCRERLGCDLYQLYAPAEAAPLLVARQPAPPSGQVARPPAYILDGALQPVPLEVFGELFFPAGPARGYLGRPDLTAECFVPSPLSVVSGQLQRTTDNGQLTTDNRLYRTGDWARRRADGSLELAPSRGRLAWVGDNRIDLDAVEAALLEDPAVEQCAVLARNPAVSRGMSADGPSALMAYIVAGGAFAPERLAAHLGPRLPAALRPDAYIPIAHLPLTGAGLVDRQALERIELIEPDLVRRWEQQLRARLESAEAAVVEHDAAEPAPPLHLSELLPGWDALPDTGTPAPPAAAPTGMGAPALSGDLALHIPDDAPQTLAEALIRTAARYPDKGIIHIQSDGAAIPQTYAQLLDEARRILGGLTAGGMRPGDRAILQIERLSEHLATFWACILGGITPVTVAVALSYDERNAVVNKLYNTWELLEHPPILAGARLVEPLSGLGALLPMRDLQLLSVEELRDHPPAEQISPAGPQQVAFFQLTSGSTGVPKCIQETNRGVICHIHASQQVNGYSADDTTLNWLPMDHVVPLLMYHVKDVYLGCRQIQARTDTILADPLRWLDLIAEYRVTHTWAPNFGYKLLSDRLARAGGRSWDLSSLRRFLNAGEQVTLAVVREFLHAVAPFGVAAQAMQPAYGMAELCTAMTYVCDFDLAASVGSFDKRSLYGQLQQVAADDPAAVPFVEVGPPTPGVQVRIVDRADGLLPEAVIGRVQVRGEVVTPGYLNNPAANQEAFAGEGWFYTGDLGFLLDGRLTITGREKEVIIINGANYYCYEIEDIVNAIPGVEATYAAAVAIDDPRGGTEGIAIFFSPAVEAPDGRLELIKNIRSRMVAALGLSPRYAIPVPRHEFPKTTSGKIQRTHLKTALLAGQFQETLKQIDIALANDNTLPDWFYHKVWRRREVGVPQPLDGPALVFLDELGLGQALCARLRAAGRPCVAVEAGDDFAQLAPDRYRITPGAREHYRALLEALARDGPPIVQVLHLWTYAAADQAPADPTAIDQGLDLGFYSLLFLTQALAQAHTPDRPLRLDVVASRAQAVADEDSVAGERSAVVGLVKTIPQELPWLDCRHIDLPIGPVAANVAHLLREINSRQKEREVAYRDGARLVARLKRADLRRAPEHELPFTTGGVYLISGGLGGIGARLATYLREQHDARLILVGRTPLEGATAERLSAWQELRQHGDALVYEAADICDLDALREVVARAEARWQRPLDGVIHLAGSYHERLLADETREGCEAILRPKLNGTRALGQLLAERPGALFLAFSSANSLFGGFGVGAYAAANSGLEGLVRAHRSAGHPRSYCYAWSMWEEVGISRGLQMKDLAHARGYAAISPRQGLLALLAALHHGQTDLLIGLDGSRPHIRRLDVDAEPRTRRLWAYVGGEQRVDAALADLAVYDRFQTRSTCAYVSLAALPRTPDGRIDRQALTLPGDTRQAHKSAYVAPQSELERMIAALWQDTLGVERVGVHDNFFDLGGQSLLMVQVQGKLRAALNLDLSMVDMFRYPTVSALAGYLGALEPAPGARISDQGRAQRQRAALERQKQLARAKRGHDE